MTRLLAIDASTWWGGVALLEGDGGSARLVAEIGLLVPDSHAGRLLPIAESLLLAAAWTRESVDAYAAVRGPGSFTGIRVGLGLVAGLALVSRRPCFGVDTLQAMAEAYGPAGADRVPLLDAGRNQVYGARFDASGSPPSMIRPIWVGDADSALEPGAASVIFGSGALTHAPALRAAGYSGPLPPGPTSVAAAAGRIALARLAAGEPGSEALAPLYVRPADAEVKLR